MAWWRTLALATLAAASCTFDSSGLVRRDGGAPDVALDRRPDSPIDSATDLPAVDVPRIRETAAAEVAPADAGGPDKPPAKCAAWADWSCSEPVYALWDCDATCDDGVAKRVVKCTTTACTCKVGANESGCSYQTGWGCPRCEDALNDGCCRP